VLFLIDKNSSGYGVYIEYDVELFLICYMFKLCFEYRTTQIMLHVNCKW